MSDDPELPEEIRKKLLEGDRDTDTSEQLSEEQLDQVTAGTTLGTEGIINAVSAPRLRGFGLGSKLP
jgi:hypothetical protein